MKIRRGEKKQFNEIVAVWEDSVKATHDFLKKEDIEELKPEILNKYLPSIDELYVYVSFFNEVVGFIGVKEEKIEMLFISSWGRGGGIGKSLVEFAVKELNAKKVDVNEQNLDAKGFYEHMGFEVVGRSPLDNEGKPFPILHMELKS